MKGPEFVNIGGSQENGLDTEGSARRSASIRGLIGACSGNLVEWFDFFVYAYTAIYFASSFFPSGNQTSQLLATAGIFAVGFFMRPVGGWLFGWIADTRGRKTSMIISVIIMSLGSFMIAVLPTYQTIGIAAAGNPMLEGVMNCPQEVYSAPLRPARPLPITKVRS